MIKQSLSLALALSLCSFTGLATEQSKVINVAKGKTATASGSENQTLIPKLAVDGVVNRNKSNQEQSRWCSNILPNQQFQNGIWTAPSPDQAVWFQIDLGEVKTGLQDMMIEWEFAKATDYAIMVSKDGKSWTTVYQAKQKAASVDDYLEVKKPFAARYVKLAINKFERQQWPAVSIYEFQIFNGKMPETVKTIAKRFNYNSLDITGEKLKYRLPKGYKAKIIGTTYEQIIDFDGTIRRPISDKTTLVTFEISHGSEMAQTATIPVTIKGKDYISSYGNPKPAVVPALQEWVGQTGFYTLSEKINLQVGNEKNDHGDSFEALQDSMEIFAKDYQDMTGKKMSIMLPRNIVSQNDSIISVALDPQQKLGDEGYQIDIRDNFISISAKTPQGAFWATRTLLQIIKTNEGKIPCGTICDYPQYPVRGMMLDVGRKPITIEMLYDVMKTMSWYKMNDFQIHLNDCFIWLHDYTKIPNKRNDSAENKAAAIKEVLAANPTAFRLESNMVGKDGTPLTSPVYSYSKKDFAKLIEQAQDYGVQIVPEFDVPGHAMSFVKVRPDLMYRGYVHKEHDVERAAMLDASNDIYDTKTGRTYRQETMKFIEKVFDEYLLPQGSQPAVFSNAPVIHIGTDEYYGNAEDYRAFADKLLRYVQSRGHTPRLWGSFTKKQGKTPVVAKGVQMHIWARDWQLPQPAIDAGYDIINILDANSYIVPNGSGNVGCYQDLLPLQNIYSENWQPSRMAQYHIIPGHPQMLGAQWALWNDNSFRRDTGLVDYDLFDRIQETCSVFAEKTWANGTDMSYQDFKKIVSKVDLPPRANPRHIVKSKTPDGVIVDLNAFSTRKENAQKSYQPITKKNVCLVKGRKGQDVAANFGGKSSFYKMPIDNLAPNYVAEFWICRTGDEKEQILFNSYTGQFKPVQKETGKVGISHDGWDYSFDYTLRKGEWVKMRLEANGRNLILFVNDQKIGSPKRHQFSESHRYTSFILPLQYIGSPTNAFHGLIEGLRIIKK